MLKRKKVVLFLTMSILMICMIGILSVRFLAFLFEDKKKISTSIEEFQGREALFKGHPDDFRSMLLVFPEKLYSSMNVEEYYHASSSGLFDGAYEILLVYTLNSQEYVNEKKRIENIKLKSGEEEHAIIYNENDYHFPAYITIHQSDGTREYVLFDDTRNRIACIFAQITALDKAYVKDEYRTKSKKFISNLEGNIYYFKRGEVSGMPNEWEAIQ